MAFKICFILIFLLGVLAAPAPLHACACCAHADTWERTARPLDSREREIVTSLTLDTGDFRGDTGERGLPIDGKLTPFHIRGTFRGNTVVFIVSSPPDTAPTTFVFTYVKQVVSSKLDPHLTPQLDPNNITLYKELTFTGTLTITGPLRPQLSNSKIPAQLILQGRGNHCTDPTDWTHWILKFSTYTPNSTAPDHFVGSGSIAHP